MMSHRLFPYYYICNYLLICSKKYHGHISVVTFATQENTKLWDIHALRGGQNIIDYYYKLKVKCLSICS